MTEEDQLLVAKAALAGVRFWRRDNLPTGYWVSTFSPNGSGMFTIGRAAAYAMRGLGLMSVKDYNDYSRRTIPGDHRAQDVDIKHLQHVAAGALPAAPDGLPPR